MGTMRTPASVLAAIVSVVLMAATPASSSTWTVGLKTGSAGEAVAQPAPVAPSGASASCYSTTQQKITVTWTAVTHATSYTILDSTTSAAGTYTATATGQTGTTWTSATLGSANYWFKVEAYVGSNWVSTTSTATGETTISNGYPKCQQP